MLFCTVQWDRTINCWIILIHIHLCVVNYRKFILWMTSLVHDRLKWCCYCQCKVAWTHAVMTLSASSENHDTGIWYLDIDFLRERTVTDSRCFLLIFALNMSNVCHILARLANLSTGLYILPSVISSFLTGAKLSQDILDRFSRFFHQMKGICVNFIGLDLFFRFLKGRCHGNQFLTNVAKWPSFNTLAFQNGFEYRNSDLQALNGIIFATLCAILMKIGPVTPEIITVEIAPLWIRWQKLGYHTKYLSKYGTVCHQHLNIGTHMYGNYKTDISFVVAQVTLLW